MKENVFSLGLVLLLTLAATSAAAMGAPEYWPAERWRTSTPEAQGFSSAELSKAFDFIIEMIMIGVFIALCGAVILDSAWLPCTNPAVWDPETAFAA